jgi:RNA polymerase sigma factor (sigma-70 family)
MWPRVPVLLEDRALLTRFREGDRGALEVVYRYFLRDVTALLRMGFASASAGARVPGIGDSAALADAVQEVFVRAFADGARLSYDGLRPYRPYLLRIARNVRIDQLRAAGRELLLGDAAALDAHSLDFDALVETNAALPEIEQSPERQELKAATRAYVETLDGEAQRFVQLRFVEELPQLEVAERMAVSRRRVRTLESRVLSGLRKALRTKARR